MLIIYKIKKNKDNSVIIFVKKSLLKKVYLCGFGYNYINEEYFIS